MVVSNGAATREVVGQDGVMGGREGTDLNVPTFSRMVPSWKLIPEFKDKLRDLDQKLPHSPIISKKIVSCPSKILEAKKILG